MRALAAALVLLALVALPAASAMAGELELGNLILDNEAGNISVRFGVRLDDLAELEEELSLGTTVGLTCEAAVYRRKSLWADTRVAGTEWVSPLSKDVLANDYVIKMPGDDRVLRDKDLAALLGKAWGQMSLDLGPWQSLVPGHEYRLEMRIGMDRVDVPTWLRYVVFFWSFDLYEPVSYRLDFSY